jgi:large subunit ribosomal protein L30
MGVGNARTLTVRLVRSPIGRKPSHRRTVQALGLRRIGQTVEQTASPAVMGMLNQVSYLLDWSETTAEEA